MKAAVTVTSAFLVLVSLLHVARVLLGFDVVVEGHAVPAWVSVPAFLITGGLAVWLWRSEMDASPSG